MTLNRKVYMRIKEEI